MILYDFHDFRFANSLSDPHILTPHASPVSPVSPPRLLRDVEKSRCPQSMSNSEETKPTRAKPATDKADPTQQGCRSNKENPAAAKSRIDTNKAGHANDLTNATRPTLQKSTTEGRKPSCAQLCKDKLGPEFPQSTRESKNTKPSRDEPSTEIVRSSHAKSFGKIKWPSLLTSKTNGERSEHEKLRRNGVNPKVAESTIGKAKTGPAQLSPEIKTADSKRVKSCASVDKSK